MKHTSKLSWVLDHSSCEALLKSVHFLVIAHLNGDFLHTKFDQVSEIKAKRTLVGSFVMSFDYNVPIPIEKVSKKSPNGAISAFSKLSRGSPVRFCDVT